MRYKENRYFAHIRSTHRKAKMESCNICEKSVKNIQVHMTKNHEYSNKIECGFCGKYFPKGSLKRHTKQKHEHQASKYRMKCQESPKSIQCDKCEFETHSKKSMYGHRLRCQKPKEYECHVCRKKLSSSSCLKKHHEVVHEKIKNVKCNTCEKLFSDVGNLKSHNLRIHEEKSPEKMKCDFCDFSTNARYLERHIRVNHIETRYIYKCDICDIEYYQESSLRRHYKVNHEKKEVSV